MLKFNCGLSPPLIFNRSECDNLSFHLVRSTSPRAITTNVLVLDDVAVSDMYVSAI